MVVALSAVRGALDYVANRPQNGTLAFMPSEWDVYRATLGSEIYSLTNRTVIVFSDTATNFALVDYGTGASHVMTLTPAALHPVAILTGEGSAELFRYVDVFEAFPWRSATRLDLFDWRRGRWSIRLMTVAGFRHHIRVNNTFRNRADLWYLPPP